MSRGPGRIERAIRALFDAHPDLAFITDELAEHCYPNAPAIERKHQVSVLRAAHKIMAADPDWRARRRIRNGSGWVFFNASSLQSYALSRLIDSCFGHYCSPERAAGLRVRRWFYASERRITRLDLLTKLEEPPNRAVMAAPEGTWFRVVQEHRARRDGDHALADRLAVRREYEFNVWLGVFSLGARAKAEELRKCFPALTGVDNETLNEPACDRTVLAMRVRDLIGQNDPDLVRAELAQIAAVLDGLAGKTQGE
jgi:hypothetical protein